MTRNATQFITYFPNCKFRYLDLTGSNRPPVSSAVERDDLNQAGYCAFFTPNGFGGDTATKENCVNLSAFFIDIDKKLTPDEIQKINDRLEPTFIVETMHGLHFYWCLDEVIYKEEVKNWDEIVGWWERIEQSIVNTIPEADKAVKDVPRILRLPGSFYWKKTGEKYKTGTEGVFKVSGIHKAPACTYSMEQVKEAFPIITPNLAPPVASPEKLKADKDSFFKQVNEAFPIEDRASFQALISGAPGTLPRPNCRNQALLVASTLMRQAGWPIGRAFEQIKKVGWHGMESETGGWNEIKSTIESGFFKSYTYSYKNEIIAHNMPVEELQEMQSVFTAIFKGRKEEDKTRFSTYEHEVLAKHPHFRKNSAGIIFDYQDGVYRMMSDQEISDIVLSSLEEDFLWNYRTRKNVSDKVACLISIIPYLIITNDGGYVANVKNGLLNIYTKELKPHTPDFVSLIQYPVAYDKDAKCPIWEKCVLDWMLGDEQLEKITLLKQFCGYILSSSMLYDRALFMVGDGGNGKSTFIDTISMVIGRQSTSHIDLESLYGAFGMQGLIGKRLNIIEEVHGNFYQSNKLKKVISGEPVTIDIKYKEQFTFRPQAKFVFAVNQMPRVDDTSTATERRICAVHFKNNYRLNPNIHLRSEFGHLAKELSGILNWMIEGACDLAEKGNFIITREQTHMLNEYRQENSSVEGFIAECLVFEEGEEIETPVLYDEYKKWCQKDGRKFKANISFTKEVKAYGKKGEQFTFKEREYAGRESKFIGVRLSPHWVAQNNAFKYI